MQSGVIPRLVAIMREYPENDPLVNVCLLALCNLADMGEEKSAIHVSDCFLDWAQLRVYLRSVRREL